MGLGIILVGYSWCFGGLDIEWTFGLAWTRMANEKFGLTVTIHTIHILFPT
jgi:hypothetical protein